MKRTLLFALLVLAYQLGMAQNITSFSFSNNIRNVIVRQQTNDHEVIYLESGNNHYLTYMNDPTSVRKLVIPNELEFHDMVIYNEYAYFCGTNTAIRKGIVGYFHIDSLFRGISNIYVYSNFQLNTSYVTSLDALTVYRGGLRQQLCIAAVGATSNKKACAMEIVKTLPHWRYTIGESTDASESITNICHTDQYVVTAGTIHNNADEVCLRFYPIDKLFLSEDLHNIIHKHPSDTDIHIGTFSEKSERVEFNTYVQTFNFYEAEVISHTSSLGNTECW